MSSLDAVRARVRSGVTYDMVYMRQVHRKYFVCCYFCLAIIHHFFNSDLTTRITPIVTQHSRMTVGHRLGAAPAVGGQLREGVERRQHHVGR